MMNKKQNPTETSNDEQMQVSQTQIESWEVQVQVQQVSLTEDSGVPRPTVSDYIIPQWSCRLLCRFRRKFEGLLGIFNIPYTHFLLLAIPFMQFISVHIPFFDVVPESRTYPNMAVDGLLVFLQDHLVLSC